MISKICTSKIKSSPIGAPFTASAALCLLLLTALLSFQFPGSANAAEIKFLEDNNSAIIKFHKITPEDGKKGLDFLADGKNFNTEMFTQTIPGALIVREFGAKNRDKLKEVMETMDSDAAEDIETRIIRLQYAEARGLQIIIRYMYNCKERGDDQFKIFADERTNSLVLQCPGSRVEEVTNMIRNLDTRTLQVMVDVMIAEVTLNKDDTFGMDWSYQQNKLFNDSKLSGTAQMDAGYLGQTARDGAQGFKYSILDPDKFNLFLNTLVKRNGIDVLSNPKILTVNNKEAQFDITTKEPVLKTTNADGVVSSSIDYLDIGIKLKVKPNINIDNFIRMELDQTIQQIVGTRETALNSPIYASRQAKTNLMVKDRNTIIIGGIISENRTDETRHVPILGSIPGLKSLFRRQTKTTSKTELMMFITPMIILDEDMAGKVTADEIEELKNPRIKNYLKGEMSNTLGTSLDPVRFRSEIVSVDDDRIIINRGIIDGLRPDMLLVVSTQGKNLYDPNTNQVLGNQSGSWSGVLRIADANLRFSEAELIKDPNRIISEKSDLKLAPGMEVRFPESYNYKRWKDLKVIIRFNPDGTTWSECSMTLQNLSPVPLETDTFGDGILNRTSKFFIDGKEAVTDRELQPGKNGWPENGKEEDQGRYVFRVKYPTLLPPGGQCRVKYTSTRKILASALEDPNKFSFSLNSDNFSSGDYEFWISKAYNLIGASPEATETSQISEWNIVKYRKEMRNPVLRARIDLERVTGPAASDSNNLAHIKERLQAIREKKLKD